MLPLPECPLREQSGLEQQRDELLLRFIHVLMTEMAHEIQVESRVARLFGEVNNTSWRSTQIAHGKTPTSSPSDSGPSHPLPRPTDGILGRPGDFAHDALQLRASALGSEIR